ncbi:MAG: adenosylhomocysteinase [Euzebya sp.]
MPTPADRSRIADPDLAHDGLLAIQWARQHSPVVDSYLRDRLRDGALAGRRVALVVHLEAKTALLATVLADAGAQVVVAGSNPLSTRDEIAAALVSEGIEVHSTRASGYPAWEKDLLAVADSRPEFVIDDGAELTVRMARDRPQAYAQLQGVSEQTTTGVARLESLHRSGRLPFPAMAANNAACKHLFDNRYGTGQSTIQAILNLTNMLMPGKQVVVFGYGWVGRGLATYIRAMGGSPVVVEIDPIKALEAFMDGQRVATADQALPTADFVITATGGLRAVSTRHFDMLADGVILANAGHHDLEVDVEALALAATAVTPVRDGIERFDMPDGRSVHVLAHGALVNIAGGLGHPIEIMDLSFAVQGVGCHELARGGYPPGVHVIPLELDREIAAAKLAAHGLSVDVATADQVEDVDAFLGHHEA